MKQVLKGLDGAVIESLQGNPVKPGAEAGAPLSLPGACKEADREHRKFLLIYYFLKTMF